MPDYSDDAVAKRRDEVNKLREKVQEAKSGSGSNLNEESNKVTMAALDAEEQRLKVELERHKAVNSKRAVTADTKDTIEQIKETAPDATAAKRGRSTE